MKTEEVLYKLKMMHDPRKWAFFDELRIGTGYGKDSEQRLDAFAIHYFPSKRNVSRCYEIKVSKGDFKKELLNPLKRRAGVRLCNEFYFVTPAGLCKIEDIPLECGLIEVSNNNDINVVIKAPFRDVCPPPWLFMAAVCRRFDKPRLDEYLEYLEENKKLKIYGDVLMRKLKDHIEKWKNFSDGNKEVPDQIADALTAIYYDTMDTIEKNKMIDELEP